MLALIVLEEVNFLMIIPGVSSTSMKCSSAAVLSSSGSSNRPINASRSFGQCTMYVGSNIIGPTKKQVLFITFEFMIRNCSCAPNKISECFIRLWINYWKQSLIFVKLKTHIQLIFLWLRQHRFCVQWSHWLSASQRSGSFPTSYRTTWNKHEKTRNHN